MIQWHPLFAHLLRPVLQDYYDIQTNVPVGDLPRQADIILLRRTAAGRPPFQSLWRHLSRWNILEFKGRSESARVADLDLLVEVGLGINRRLQEQEAAPNRSEVSFWYLANHLGRRFLRDATRLLDGLEQAGEGLWHWRVLSRPVWLVSNRDVPITRESIPVHLVSEETTANERAVAEMVLAQPEWWTTYGPWLTVLYPNLWKEIKAMARRRGATGELDLSALIEEIGLPNLIQMVGPQRVIAEIGLKPILDQATVDDLLANLSPAQREQLRQRLQENRE